MEIRSLRNRQLDSDYGFSVVEVAVAIVLLGVVLLAAAPAVLAAAQVSLLSSVGAEASRTAYTEAEEAAAANSQFCSAGTSSVAFNPSPSIGELTFTQTTTVTCESPSLSLGVGEAQVVITSSAGAEIANVITRFTKEG